ncbi:MAG: molybdopterin-dependent oxidoreductase [Coriobacteriaceae bacterium]|jgi:molybdopterin-containing oxidoreductase family molybdopterin binding subunit|nr:molybdopterin-dependent oxidoreductase [Coriobacteriaceae bacterium]
MGDQSSARADAFIMRRRRFLQLAAGAAIAGAGAQVLSACAQQVGKNPEQQAVSDQAKGTGQPEYDKAVRCVCAPNCVGTCAINAYVKDDVIIKVEPADFPNKAYNRICLRGISNALQRVYSPDRVKYPMKRVGERGQGSFVRISWEEAIDLIYENMQKNIETYGSTANAFIGMTGNYGVYPQVMATMMAMTYDATAFTNFGIMGDNACNMGFLPTLGVEQDASSWEDMIGSKAIIMFGCNYAETNMQEMHFVFDAQEAGSKLVVVDPRFSKTASKADWWIPIRPGTDAALALGMMSHIVAQKLHDEAYVKRYTNAAFLVDPSTKKLLRQGDDYLVWDSAQSQAVPVAALPDEMKPAYPSVEVTGTLPKGTEVPEGAALYGSFKVVLDGTECEAKPAFQLLVESLEAYTPEKASAICEVPADDIVKLAELYTNETPASLRVSQGTNRYWNGHLPTRALIQLAAITGNIGKPHANINWAGGSLMRLLFSLPGSAVMPYEGHVATQQPGSQWYDIVASQKPYPIKFLWVNNYGWGTQGPDRNKLEKEVLPQLDFIVVSEQILTPGACYADLVLPISSNYENPFDVIASWSNMYVQASDQAISQQWESKTDYQVAQLLAERFGILEATSWKLDAKEFARKNIIKGNLAPEFNTIDFDELDKNKIVRANFSQDYRAFESMRFRTPSGKIELYTESLAEFGEELACHYEPYEGNRNEKAAKYPFTFMNCRTVYTTHSQHVRLPWIREVAPEPWLEISPTDAAARGFETGDTVEVFNDRGSYQVKLLVTPEIKPGCLNQRQGWWPQDFVGNTHYSSLLHMQLNPAQDAISETNYAPYDNLVDLKKA